MREIADLESLSGDEDLIDEFNTEYEKMLTKFRNDRPILLKMKKILHSQTLFLIELWSREKERMKKWEEKQSGGMMQ